MDCLKKRIDVARGYEKADMVLKNAKIINVYTRRIERGDVAIVDETIVGVGNYQGFTEVDCSDLFVAPGFIDAHVHIESSMVTPEVYSDLVIRHGVTSAIADPHEIANVLGLEGIELMLENAKKGCADLYFMLPSCVPSTDFEDNGAFLSTEELKKYVQYPQILGLAEVMDVHAVLNKKADMLNKVSLFANIDGHSPKCTGKDLNAYLCAGIKTDHECTQPEEALEKISRGIYVMLREGSAAKDLESLIPAVNQDNYHRFLFCTDDRHIEDLYELGSIDYCIKKAIEYGLEPVMAYTIATINAAMCYQLNDRGAIAPGMKADLVVLSDLERVKIEHVVKRGRIYQAKTTFSELKKSQSINLEEISNEHLKIKEVKPYVHVIKAVPHSLVTKHIMRSVKIKNNQFMSVIEEEGRINKLACFERHQGSGKYSVGFIEGIGIKHGAIAQTIAHDSHNVIVVGDGDEDMVLAVNTLIRTGGGIVFVSKGRVLEVIELPIAGLLSDEHPDLIYQRVKRFNHLARKHGVRKDIDPSISLSFMALPVIPELKLTPRGLFDVVSFQFIDLFSDERR